MTYNYTVNNKKYHFCLDESKEHCHPIYIDKKHSFQDIYFEERAMNVLSPLAFVAYCYLSIKAPGLIWVVGLDTLPLSEADSKKALNELIEKGYLQRCTLNVYDEAHELTELIGFVFIEHAEPVQNTLLTISEEKEA